MNAKRTIGASLIGVALLAASSAVVAQGTIVLEAEADTYVRTDLFVRRNDNYGCQQFFSVGASRTPDGDADAMRALIRFNLDGITAARVRKAVLRATLFGFDGPGGGVYTVDVHRIVDDPMGILTPWIEGNGMEPSPANPFVPVVDPPCTNVDDAFGVAWDGVDANNSTQPDFDPVVEASATIDEAIDAPGDVIEWDLTALVQDWIDGVVPNHGVMLRDETVQSTFRGAIFGAREGKLLIRADPRNQNGPRLIITTAGGGGPPSK